MATTTKTRAKSKLSKLVIAPMAPAPIPATAEGMISAMSSLKLSAGWALVRSIIEENIKYLETAILERIDPLTHKDLSNEELDKLRVKRALNIDLRDTPENYIAMIQKTGVAPVEYDPYWQSADAMRASERSLKTE